MGRTVVGFDVWPERQEAKKGSSRLNTMSGRDLGLSMESIVRLRVNRMSMYRRREGAGNETERS